MKYTIFKKIEKTEQRSKKLAPERLKLFVSWFGFTGGGGTYTKPQANSIVSLEKKGNDWTIIQHLKTEAYSTLLLNRS